MKMFKKIMAVVLTGALAVSMLTGCAITDKMVGNAVKKALETTCSSGGDKATFTEVTSETSTTGKPMKASNDAVVTALKNAISTNKTAGKNDKNAYLTPANLAESDGTLKAAIESANADGKYVTVIVKASTSEKTVRESIGADTKTALTDLIGANGKGQFYVGKTVTGCKENKKDATCDWVVITVQKKA